VETPEEETMIEQVVLEVAVFLAKTFAFFAAGVFVGYIITVVIKVFKP
jgi:hypothetical protein